MSEHVFVGFGFGPIQSGLFVKEAFASGNFKRIVISEIDQKLVDAVRADGGSYYVNVAKSDGIEVLKTIRKNGNTLPVLMLTAKAEVEDKVLGLDYGADDYLTKPFSVKELMVRIKALLKRYSQSTETKVDVSRSPGGSVLLDRERFFVTQINTRNLLK